MKRIVILGGGGFIGSAVAEKLAARGDTLTIPTRVLARANHLSLLPTADICVANIRDGATLRQLLAGAEIPLGMGQGATVRVGTLSGTGGRIISGADGRDANWQVGGLNQTSSAAVVITGNATSFNKVGTGTLTLTGSSTYAGGTTVSAGTLNLDAASAIGAGSLTIAAGASVNALRAFAISTDGAAAGRVVNVAGSLSMADSEYVQTDNLTGAVLKEIRRALEV